MARKNANGEGSIAKRKDGRWCGRVTIGYDKNGKQKRKCIYGKTQKEVQEKMTALKNDILINDGYVRDDEVTLSQWGKTYLFEYKKPTVRASSFQRDESIFRVHIQSSTIGKMKLKDIKPFHIQSFINTKSKDLSASSIKKIYQLLNRLFEQAVINDFIRKSPIIGIIIPKKSMAKEEVETLTREEQKLYINALDHYRTGILYLTTLFTGMRVGEVIALTWNNIDLKNGEISVSQTLKRVKVFNDDGTYEYKTLEQAPKTSSGFRTIPIPPFLVEALKKHKLKLDEEALAFGKQQFNQKNFVFPSEVGTALTSRNVLRTHELICNRANVKRTTFHALRHTFATRMLEDGIDAKIVQYWLGHSSVELTLNVYVHVQEKAKLAAVKQQDSLYQELMK